MGAGLPVLLALGGCLTINAGSCSLPKTLAVVSVVRATMWRTWVRTTLGPTIGIWLGSSSAGVGSSGVRCYGAAAMGRSRGQTCRSCAICRRRFVVRLMRDFRRQPGENNAAAIPDLQVLSRFPRKQATEAASPGGSDLFAPTMSRLLRMFAGGSRGNEHLTAGRRGASRVAIRGATSTVKVANDNITAELLVTPPRGRHETRLRVVVMS